ncbi:MAG TPA: phosphoribosylglycinamide formyltransferase [Xanthobacteraceae bacterium]|nr:phosphoribosylglycinamide formyltransferase [Xanthobacteraceae bacterium]
MARKRVAILISGRGSNMSALIEAARAREYPAEIALVLSNRPTAKGLEIAKSAGIATAVVDHTAYKTREEFDAEIEKQLAAANIEIICLAGFMRVLTAQFVKNWEGYLLNIHPSLLPAFKGIDTHVRALDAGVKIHGCTVHFVVPEIDSGPIIMQAAVPVLEGDDEEELATRVLAAEHRIYPAALKLLAEGKLAIEGERVVVAGVNGEADETLTSPRI